MIHAGTVSWVRRFSNVICFYSSKGVVTDHDLRDDIYDLVSSMISLGPITYPIDSRVELALQRVVYYNGSIFLGTRHGMQAIGWF